MNQFFSEWEAKAIQENREHLEVILLLITHHIDHFVYRIVLKTQFGGTDILGHIDGRAIGAEQQFLIQTVLGKIRPNRPVFAAVESTGSETFLHFRFTLKIGIGFVVYLIERNAHAAVSLIKTGIDPFVHSCP